jgi:hypothetical protein
MDNQNVPIGAIQRILGHENCKTTEIYLYSIGQSERDAIAVFERASRNSHMEPHTEGNLVGSKIAVNGWKITGAGGRN